MHYLEYMRGLRKVVYSGLTLQVFEASSCAEETAVLWITMLN